MRLQWGVGCGFNATPRRDSGAVLPDRVAFLLGSAAWFLRRRLRAHNRHSQRRPACKRHEPANQVEGVGGERPRENDEGASTLPFQP